MNVRLSMYDYCYSNLGAIYAKVYSHQKTPEKPTVENVDYTNKIYILTSVASYSGLTYSHGLGFHVPLFFGFSFVFFAISLIILFIL